MNGYPSLPVDPNEQQRKNALINALMKFSGAIMQNPAQGSTGLNRFLTAFAPAVTQAGQGYEQSLIDDYMRQQEYLDMESNRSSQGAWADTAREQTLASQQKRRLTKEEADRQRNRREAFRTQKPITRNMPRPTPSFQGPMPQESFMQSPQQKWAEQFNIDPSLMNIEKFDELLNKQIESSFSKDRPLSLNEVKGQLAIEGKTDELAKIAMSENAGKPPVLREFGNKARLYFYDGTYIETDMPSKPAKDYKPTDFQTRWRIAEKAANKAHKGKATEEQIGFYFCQLFPGDKLCGGDEESGGKYSSGGGNRGGSYYDPKSGKVIPY